MFYTFFKFPVVEILKFIPLNSLAHIISDSHAFGYGKACHFAVASNHDNLDIGTAGFRNNMCDFILRWVVDHGSTKKDKILNHAGIDFIVRMANFFFHKRDEPETLF